MIPQSHRHIFEDDSLILEFLFEAMVDDLAIILGSDSSKHRSLGFGDSEPFEGIFDIFWHIVPGFIISSALCLREVVDTLEIKRTNIWSPSRERFCLIDFKGFKSECEHPLGLLVRLRYLSHDHFTNPRKREIAIDHFVTMIEGLSVDVSKWCSI